MSNPAGPLRVHSIGNSNVHHAPSKYPVAHKFQRRDSSPLMPEDFEDITLEPSNFNNRSFSDTASTQSLSSRDSVASSTSTAALDEEYDTDATSTTSSVLIDPHKLNGYAINSFKSKSVQSLHLNNTNNNIHISASRDSLTGDLKHTNHHHTLRPTSPPPTAAGAKINSTDSINNVNALSRQRSMINLPHRPHSHTSVNRPFDNLAPLTTSFGGPSSSEINHISASTVPSRRQVQQKPLLRKAISTSRLSTGSVDTSGLDTTGLPQHRLKSRTGSVRLTRKQIEAQFDADDDVIDDSCIWNVPLSPALYAQSKKMSAVQKQVAPLASKSSQKNRSQPSLHEMPMISETEAVTEFIDPLETDVRGLEGLDRDVQELTKKFEEMPDDITVVGNRRASDPVKLASSRRSSRLSIGSTASSSTPATPLSQTRPSWLPPKSAEEEKKHMKQFHDMLELAVIAEKKKEEALKCQQEAKQRQEKKDEEEWTRHVLPKFDAAIKDSKTRELWWRGVPERLREQVWKRKVGNDLGITNDVYRASVAKSVDSKVLKQIDEDAEKVFPELHIFGKSSPLHEDLVNIVRAYCSYRPDVGYQPGLVKIAAVLLLNLSPFDAFVVLANLLDNSISVAIWKREERLLSGFYTSFLKVLNTKLPKLYEHFQHVRLAPSAYLEPLVQSWFVEHLHIDIVKRIVDVMVFEGDGFLLRVALGVLTVLEFKLYGNAQEVLNELSPSCTTLEVGHEDEFIAAVRLALRA